MTSDEEWAKYRRPWRAGPDTQSSGWLTLDDDDLLHHIEVLPRDHEHDNDLLCIVRSDRHFFIRQEAAKRVRNTRMLMECAQDRHVGQILVRRMSRIEDMNYLELLMTKSLHIEVRNAARAQLAIIRKHLEQAAARDAAQYKAAESSERK
ncbi:MAG: hypothetical protein MUF51_10765 [Vicinamibacteria bacterium]|jgi:hypothetical protein|nr:hypothetical protein [Vicinamibacteria bacterium]